MQTFKNITSKKKLSSKKKIWKYASVPLIIQNTLMLLKIKNQLERFKIYKALDNIVAYNKKCQCAYNALMHLKVLSRRRTDDVFSFEPLQIFNCGHFHFHFMNYINDRCDFYHYVPVHLITVKCTKNHKLRKRMHTFIVN